MTTASREMKISIGQSIIGRTVSGDKSSGLGFWQQFALESVVGIEEEIPVLANRLFQNVPNPFNPSTMIQFTLTEPADVQLTLFDLQGRRVAEILNESRSIGEHTLNYHPRNLASGVYVLRLSAGDFQENRRIVLLK
ncbi:MAG: T9SS type A sorting domain-containing protein [bacterium]|nr:T9SS type A sorting domain-containing protein [bacterium]